ncbi:hypothetical protein CN279_03400 [Bacillus anthracis]|nr:hypothetical protein CN279_03400 [Bacillus anthracis]
MEPVAKTSLFLAYVFQFTNKTFIFFYFYLITTRNGRVSALNSRYIMLKVKISKKLLVKNELILNQ